MHYCSFQVHIHTHAHFRAATVFFFKIHLPSPYAYIFFTIFCLHFVLSAYYSTLYQLEVDYVIIIYIHTFIQSMFVILRSVGYQLLIVAYACVHIILYECVYILWFFVFFFLQNILFLRCLSLGKLIDFVAINVREKQQFMLLLILDNLASKVCFAQY